MHELNFIYATESNKMAMNMVPDFLKRDLYSHLNYPHLPTNIVPDDKMKSGSVGVMDVESLPILKSGHPKGAKS